MTDPDDHRESPDNNEGTPPRHRLWAIVAVLFLCAAAFGAVAQWVTRPPVLPPTPSEAVNVTLPPPASSSETMAPFAQATLPPAVSPPEAAAPVAIQPSAPPTDGGQASGAAGGTPQVAILPPPAVNPSNPQATNPGATNPQGTQAAGPPAWLRFATTAPADIRDRPRIAIVIDDLGLDRARTERVIGLSAAVTLSFIAYSGDLPRQSAAARRNGHEMIVHVPMEPVNAKIDMGPNGLATNQPRTEVLRRLDWDLGRFDGYVGINNHMGSRFTGDAEAMGWVMDDLKERGLMFLDSRTIATSIGAKAASAAGVPFAERDVFLDDDQSAVAVQQRLKDVETVARKRGTAIAIGHPHDATIDALVGWIAGLPAKGLVLVPLTEIVKARMKTG
jgi:polysaccharide deacetylase 2 family uncharacterized protein YibQ